MEHPATRNQTMEVVLTHSFLWHCKDPNFLLVDCNKFNTFCYRLEKQAHALFPENLKDTEQEKEMKEKAINKHKGDGFELFVEAMIRLFPCDKRIGPIENYQVNTTQDIGVDGHGIFGYNGKPITIQCKYRQSDHILTANQDHLTNFTSASMLHFGVDPKPDPVTGKCNMIIVSSAKSLNFFTDFNMFGNMVYAFCREDIRQLVDHNNLFWKYFYKSWIESLKNLKPFTEQKIDEDEKINFYLSPNMRIPANPCPPANPCSPATFSPSIHVKCNKIVISSKSGDHLVESHKQEME